MTDHHDPEPYIVSAELDRLRRLPGEMTLKSFTAYEYNEAVQALLYPGSDPITGGTRELLVPTVQRVAAARGLDLEELWPTRAPSSSTPTTPDHIAGTGHLGGRHDDDETRELIDTDGRGAAVVDIDALKNTLIGRSVTSVELGGEYDAVDRGWRHPQGKIVLDDGTELLLGGNHGGCSCGAGDYELSRLNDMPINGITNVEVDRVEHGQYGPSTYRVFVLAQDERFELAAFDGDDGNGYYGTGFWFTVESA